MDFNAILDEAHEAATKAMSGMTDDTHFTGCGFAWVKVHPAKGPFITYCRNKNKEAVNKVLENITDDTKKHRTIREAEAASEVRHGSRSYTRGWEFWRPGRSKWQSISIHETGARAFAEVLMKHGINASVGSRLD